MNELYFDHDEYVAITVSKSEKDFDGVQWFNDGRTYKVVGNGKTEKAIEAGYYKVKRSRDGYYMEKIDVSIDKLFEFPNDNIRKVMRGIEKFWERKDSFVKYGIVYKRGILLHGPPGTGKTSIVNMISSKLIENGGVVFTVSNVEEFIMYSDFMKSEFKKIEPDRNIITIIEDIDDIIEQYESGVLQFLDGTDQLPNNVVIATTNYPEKLKERLIRPSRFDLIVKIPKSSEDDRRFFFKKLGVSESDIEKYVENSDNYSVAHMRELFILTYVLGNDFEHALELMTEFESIPDSADYDDNKKDFGY